MRSAKRLSILLPLLVLACLAAFTTWAAVPAIPCSAQTGCPVPAATGRQPYPDEMLPMFSNASANTMGTTGPALNLINKGYPKFVKVTPYVPCTLLYAVGYTESAWKQFDASFGGSGQTLISFDCGYGVMQITGGLSNDNHGKRVAAEPAYNIGTGALSLINKWNASPFVGENDPAVVEDWYFATWAYNGWGWVNNPNNSDRFNANRPPFDGTQPRSDYPYQEIVWGFAAHPPSYGGQPIWSAVPLSLPPRSALATPIATWIPRPSPYHTSLCATPKKTLTPTRTATLTKTATRTRTTTPTPTSSATVTRPPTRTPTKTSTPVPTIPPRPTRNPSFLYDLYIPVVQKGSS